MNPTPSSSATGFVTVLGRISTLLAAVGVLAALAQAAVALLLGDAAVAAFAARPEVPPALGWMLLQRRPLALALLVLAVLFLAASWGVLRRQEWARLAFIGFLAVTAVLNFASLPLVGQLFDTARALYPPGLLDTPDGRDLLAQLQVSRMVSLFTATLTAVAFAGLHGWVGWKLCAADVRAQFRRQHRHD